MRVPTAAWKHNHLQRHSAPKRRIHHAQAHEAEPGGSRGAHAQPHRDLCAARTLWPPTATMSPTPALRVTAAVVWVLVASIGAVAVADEAVYEERTGKQQQVAVSSAGEQRDAATRVHNACSSGTSTSMHVVLAAPGANRGGWVGGAPRACTQAHHAPRPRLLSRTRSNGSSPSRATAPTTRSATTATSWPWPRSLTRASCSPVRASHPPVPPPPRPSCACVRAPCEAPPQRVPIHPPAPLQACTSTTGSASSASSSTSPTSSTRSWRSKESASPTPRRSGASWKWRTCLTGERRSARTRLWGGGRQLPLDATGASGGGPSPPFTTANTSVPGAGTTSTST